MKLVELTTGSSIEPGTIDMIVVLEYSSTL